MKDRILLAQQSTQDIIDELLADGSDPNALYIIEHHISSTNFDKLEKIAVEAYKLGYEATDPEEDVDEQNEEFITFDIVTESPLDVDIINAQIAQLIKLANDFQVNYDGWGTYFEDGTDYDEQLSDDITLH